MEALRAAWSDGAEFRPTTAPGDAIRLAQAAAQEGFDAVIGAGGDGTAHEVANGVLAANQPRVVCGFAPLGSANDYVHSLEHQFGPAADHPSAGHLVDVGRVRTDRGLDCFFINSLGIGLAGAVTVESRAIGWLQGVPLYGLATLRALWRRFETPELSLQFDDQPQRTERTTLLSLLNGRREGNFVMAPHAKLDDGQFHVVHALGMSRFTVLRLLPRLALAGPPDQHPHVRQFACHRVRVSSATPLTAHVDGEILCRPEVDTRQLDIELLPQRLAVRVFRVDSR